MKRWHVASCVGVCVTDECLCVFKLVLNDEWTLQICVMRNVTLSVSMSACLSSLPLCVICCSCSCPSCLRVTRSLWKRQRQNYMYQWWTMAERSGVHKEHIVQSRERGDTQVITLQLLMDIRWYKCCCCRRLLMMVAKESKRKLDTHWHRVYSWWNAVCKWKYVWVNVCLSVCVLAVCPWWSVVTKEE